MAIFLDENDQVIVQGMTGSEGRKHTARMLGAGTKIVAGTNPRAGTSVEFDVTPIGYGKENREPQTVSIPVYATVADAKAATVPKSRLFSCRLPSLRARDGSSRRQNAPGSDNH